MTKEIAILILSAWLFNKNTIFKKMSTWGWFHKSWAHGANHKDSLCPFALCANAQLFEKLFCGAKV